MFRRLPSQVCAAVKKLADRDEVAIRHRPDTPPGTTEKRNHAALFVGAGVTLVVAFGAGTTFAGSAGVSSVEELATPTMVRAD